MPIRVMAASPSLTRRHWYRTELEQRGCEVEIVDCELLDPSKINQCQPDVIVLETSLQSGVIDEVLAMRDREHDLKSMSVIVIDDRRDASQTYRLGAHKLAGYWKSPPTADELMLAIRLTVQRSDIPEVQASHSSH